MLHQDADFLPTGTIPDILANVTRTLSQSLGGLIGQPLSTAQVPAPYPTGLTLNPATWTLPVWLLVGGAVFLLARGRGRSNPYKVLGFKYPGATREDRYFKAKRSAERYAREQVTQGYEKPPIYYTASMPKKNPHRRTQSLHARRTPVRFHGAFADQRKAEVKAARLGGVIKSFTVRGQRRYGVMTAA